jgi:hypothetical protein
MRADPAISALVRATMRFDLRMAESDLARMFLVLLCLPLAFVIAHL